VNNVASAQPVLVADVHGGGLPVVLLHGQPGSAADWQAVAPRLWDDFTVVVPDRLGYGRTGGDAAGFAANAASVARLLDRLSMDQAIVVGYSWSGAVALAFAEAYRPRTAGLVLAASVGPGERFGWPDRVLATPVVGDVLAAVTLGATGTVLGSSRVQALAEDRLRGRARAAVELLIGMTGARTGSGVWRSFVAEQRVLFRELQALDTGLTTLTVPTVVLNGSADHVVPPRVADRLANAIPGAVHTVLEDAHHLLPVDHPEAVAAAVREVAKRVAAGSPGGGSDGQEAAHREG
jgi:pimeloyl-ACP methyl ester carboxylesterase